MAKAEEIDGRSSRSLSDEEVLELLDYEIESREEVPSRRGLERGEWEVGLHLVRRAAGGLNNALWMLGYEPNRRKLVVDGDTELREDMIRGLEHNMNRAPTESELNSIISTYADNQEDLWDAAPPYRSLARPYTGKLSPEREDELVERLFVEGEDPFQLSRYGDADKWELDEVIGAYLPWIDETSF